MTETNGWNKWLKQMTEANDFMKQTWKKTITGEQHQINYEVKSGTEDICCKNKGQKTVQTNCSCNIFLHSQHCLQSYPPPLDLSNIKKVLTQWAKLAAEAKGASQVWAKSLCSGSAQVPGNARKTVAAAIITQLFIERRNFAHQNALLSTTTTVILLLSQLKIKLLVGNL